MYFSRSKLKLFSGVYKIYSSRAIFIASPASSLQPAAIGSDFGSRSGKAISRSEGKRRKHTHTRTQKPQHLAFRQYICRNILRDFTPLVGLLFFCCVLHFFSSYFAYHFSYLYLLLGIDVFVLPTLRSACVCVVYGDLICCRCCFCCFFLRADQRASAASLLR